jgi:hypothetical protein
MRISLRWILQGTRDGHAPVTEVNPRRRSRSSPAPARFSPTLRKRVAAARRRLASAQTRPAQKATTTAKREERSHLAGFRARSPRPPLPRARKRPARRRSCLSPAYAIVIEERENPCGCHHQLNAMKGSMRLLP